MLERVECSPLALQSHQPRSSFAPQTNIDGHLLVLRQAEPVHFRDILCRLHIRRITSRAKNDRNLGVRIHVVGRDESPSGVVDESNEFCGDILRAEQSCKKDQITEWYEASANLILLRNVNLQIAQDCL